MNPNRKNLHPAMQTAVAMIEAATQAPASKPEQDWRLLTLKELRSLTRANLEEIKNGIAVIERSKLTAMAALAELDCAIEILEDDLGIEKPEDEDPTPWCSYCGAMQRSKCQCGPRAEND